ncbi:MAG: GTPase ObgE [Armatimonadota bacterium]|jgi:GTP-binding protein
MFIDEADIHVRAGAGGAGMVSFRRERYVPRGGPDGGDGGDGGDAILQVKAGLSTLLDFKYRSSFKAEDGLRGGANNKTGHRGADCVIAVPEGTVVRDAESGRVIGDLVAADDRLCVARGGKGGRGNKHFATATRQAPRFAEKGLPGEACSIRLELKLLADVAVIGFPNVGKSSLIARLSAARPKIADYPFTTLVPNLGVVPGPDHTGFVMADMPGLVVGAHEGAGLGHQFLRHVERVRVLVHMLDAGSVEGRDPVEDYHAINRELELHDARLRQLPQIIALNKMDLPDAQAAAPSIEAALAEEGCEILRISAATGEGLPELVYAMADTLEEARTAPTPFEAAIDLGPEPEPAKRPLKVARLGEGRFAASGSEVERLVATTDLDNEDAVLHLHAQLDRLGVLEELERLGAEDGDTVTIGDTELDYVLTPGPE